MYIALNIFVLQSMAAKIAKYGIMVAILAAILDFGPIG